MPQVVDLLSPGRPPPAGSRGGRWRPTCRPPALPRPGRVLGSPREAGGRADLVAARGDPLEDISALRRPVMVFKDGRVVVDRR